MRKCPFKINIAWYNLSLILVPIIITVTVFFEEAHTMIYMPISSLVCSFIIFVNFPMIVTSLHQRPIYYDDLIIKDFNEDEAKEIYDDRFRKKYQTIFRWVLTFTSAIVVGILVEIWYMRSSFAKNDATARDLGFVSSSGSTIDDGSGASNGSSGFDESSEYAFLSPQVVAALAIIYSLGMIYLKGSMMFGKFLMSTLKFFKKRELRKARNMRQRIAEVELKNANVAIDNDLEAGLLRAEITSSRSFSNLPILGIKNPLPFDT